MKKIVIKRVYESYSPNDGYRILVDRLWPRGIKKTDLRMDEWNKELPPSTELRKWYNHDKDKFLLFADRYKNELSAKKSELERIGNITKEQTVTLLYAAKDPKNNHAVVLAEVLNNTL